MSLKHLRRSCASFWPRCKTIGSGQSNMRRMNPTGTTKMIVSAPINSFTDLNAWLLISVNCGRKTLGDDAYYCNKELVNLLIFDAKVTNSSYGVWRFESDEERQLIERFRADLRFVATMSGLTRWQFIFGEVEVDTDREFGDYHTTAIDETWYKSAILQHHEDRAESFVYSVKYYDDPMEDSEVKVTASHAIFPRTVARRRPPA